MIKWRCALPQKNLTEGISAYAYLFMFSFFGVGGEKWGMRDEKNNGSVMWLSRDCHGGRLCLFCGGLKFGNM